MTVEETFGRKVNKKPFTPWLLIGIFLVAGIATIATAYTVFKGDDVYNPAFASVGVEELPVILTVVPTNAEIVQDSMVTLDISIFNPKDFDVVKDIIVWSSFSDFDEATNTFGPFSEFKKVLQIKDVKVHPTNLVSFKVNATLDIGTASKRLFIFKLTTELESFKTIFFSDDFSDGIADGWTVVSGSWAVESFEFSGTNGSAFRPLKLTQFEDFFLGGNITQITGTGEMAITLGSNPNTVGLWHLEENGGTTAGDSSSFVNNGTLKPLGSEPKWVIGKVGSGLKFDGVDDFVEVPNSASLNPTSQITLEAWISINEVKIAGIIEKENSYKLHQENLKLKFTLSCAGVTKNVVSPDVFPLGVFHHVAATYDGVNMKIFVNGFEVASTTAICLIDPTTTPLNIGTGVVGPKKSSFNGIIDEVRILNRALSKNEVLADSNLGSTKLTSSGSVGFKAPQDDLNILLSNPAGHTHFDDISVFSIKEFPKG